MLRKFDCLPDVGLLSMHEHLAATAAIHAASELPVIADVDTDTASEALRATKGRQDAAIDLLQRSIEQPPSLTQAAAALGCLAGTQHSEGISWAHRGCRPEERARTQVASRPAARLRRTREGVDIECSMLGNLREGEVRPTHGADPAGWADGLHR